MGGIGSGRFGRRTSRPTVSQLVSFSIVAWRKDGIIAPGYSTCAEVAVPLLLRHLAQRASVRVDLMTSTIEGPVSIEIGDHTQHLQLVSTGPSFGGRRYWFRCPECRVRRLTLYAWPTATSFRMRCRVCFDLAYRTQRIGKGARWESRAQKLFARAGVQQGDDFYYKPKRMRWTTFNRLIDDAEAFDNAAVGLGLSKFLNLASIRRYYSDD